MADSATQKTQAANTVTWVSFPDKRAHLKRLIDGNGNPGLILRVEESDAGQEVAKNAVEGGFKALRVKNFFSLMFERGKPIPFKTSDIARMLGGELVRIPKEQLKHPDMVVNLFLKAQAQAAAAKKSDSSQPDAETIESIGLNMRGQEVIKASNGRFVKIRNTETGDFHFEKEEGSTSAAFFRLNRNEDMAGIAAGVLKMAQKGTLHQRDIDRVLDAILEGRENATYRLREEMSDLLRENILRQITAIAIDNDADRNAFLRALRVNQNTGYVISRESKDDKDLRPAAGLLSMIRRLSRGFDSVDFRGGQDLSIALPRIQSTSAALQAHDLSTVPHEGLVDYAMNVLSRRKDAGSTMFLVPAGIDEDIFDSLRSEIGRNYGLEAVADIAPGVADGVRDGRAVRMLFIGDRRPEALDALPQAALRSFAVTSDDDLPTLEREVLRSRKRIRDFNAGEAELAAEAAEDDREENARQRPYQPLSRVAEPFTMIPRALEGATSNALARVARDTEPFGGVDAVVGQSLGFSVAELGNYLSAEQVDAVALQQNAMARGRGFLEADQTGVGKGRTMAAIGKAWLRKEQGNKLLYVTESAEINIPDVLRDFKAVGMETGRVMLLSSGSKFIDVTYDVETGAEIHREIVNISAKERRELMHSGKWPEGYDAVITNYTQFSQKANHENPAEPTLGEDGEPLPNTMADWLTSIASDDLMIIMDEAHNALTPGSNRGKNFRRLIDRLPPQNVVFATGTPARDPKGMDLYKPLLPQVEGSNVSEILEHISSGGEVAQEAFTTMLAEDGVMIRRDHDLSATNYEVNLPDDARMLHYQDVMNKLSPIVESMIDVSGQIGELVGNAQSLERARLVAGGMDAREAKARTNEASQYSMSIGDPLSKVARFTMVALKVDQVVEAAVNELAQGRKPLITFHATNEMLIREASRDEDGNLLSEEELAAMPELTIRDQLRRIHETLYKMKIDGERLDPRENNSELMRRMRGFIKTARNMNAGGQSFLDHKRYLDEAIAKIGDEEQRNGVKEALSEILSRMVAPSAEKDLLEAFYALKNTSFYDNEACETAVLNFEELVTRHGDTLFDEEELVNVRRFTNLFRESITPTARRENVDFIEASLPELALDRIWSTEIRADMEALQARCEDIGSDREKYAAIQESFERIDTLIDEMPDLPASPVDALIERLEANGIRCGEISGRSLCYRDGVIKKREGTDRKAIIDSYNAGDLDALLFNAAGATGGSYHAGANFKDQRPRTMMELEAPLDIIKYIQAQGRGNRMDQVASPKVLSIMTGLVSEMRILQQRNAKLRSLGASVDGNRAHPLLLNDVPDLLNKVGDLATHNVLMSSPDLARRLGFPKYAEDNMLDVAEIQGEVDEGSGTAQRGEDSLSNKVLTRSLILNAREQGDLINRIVMEFDVLIEELESRNANPLRPKEFPGAVTIKTSTIFSGQEREEDDLDTSIFLSPVYMSTGLHDAGREPVSAERLVDMVERTAATFGTEGFKPYAERITQNLPMLMRPYLPLGVDLDTAMRDPDQQRGRFAKEYHKLTDLAWMLENIQPGTGIKFSAIGDLDAVKSHTIVGLVPPKEQAYYDMASAYKIKTICPGEGDVETIALSRILNSNGDQTHIRFNPGIADGFNESYLREFSVAAEMRRMQPVQILSGNILQAITVANQHKLGTVSLFRTPEGAIHRGVVVSDQKIDMTKLPVPLTSHIVTAETAAAFCRQVGDYSSKDASTFMRIWGSMEADATDPGARDLADFIVRLTGRKAVVDIAPLRKANADFYQAREGLYEALWEKPFPGKIPDKAWRRIGTKHKYLIEIDLTEAAGRNRLYTIFELMGDIPMATDGLHRDIVNETVQEINETGPRGKEGEFDVTFFEEDEDHEQEGLDREDHEEGLGGERAPELDDLEFD